MPTITGQSTLRPGKWLIHHGQDVTNAAYIQANAAALDALPFDGLTFQMANSLSFTVQTQTAVTYSQFQTALAPVKTAQQSMTRLKKNFVMVYSTPAGDLFSDWTTVINNFANLALACKDAGIAGILYDIEEYSGSALSYPANAAGKTVTEAQAQTQLRGKQIMDAMRSAWPEVAILVTYGAWLSEGRTATTWNAAGVAYNDVAWANQLRGCFSVGLMESAIGTAATVIDGGEVYTPRSLAQFETVKAWQKTGMPANSPLIPVALRSAWPTKLSASFGVYDTTWQGAAMEDATTWQSTLTNALRTADAYVWTYIEKYDYLGGGWPTTPVPQAWINATAAARATI